MSHDKNSFPFEPGVFYTEAGALELWHQELEQYNAKAKARLAARLAYWKARKMQKAAH